MNPNPPSPREDLSEPLLSLIKDMARNPVPEDLIRFARTCQAPASRKKVSSGRSFSAVLVSLLALGLVLAVLIFREIPTESEPELAKDTPSAPVKAVPELPPPSLWAYRQAARSPEALEDLLTQHAAVLLPTGGDVSLHSFSRKEDL